MNIDRAFMLPLIAVLLLLAFTQPVEARLIRFDSSLESLDVSLLENNGAIEVDFVGSDTNTEIPFSINFFGTTYSSVFVNENGILSFGAAYTGDTGDVNALMNSGIPLISGLFADADIGFAQLVTTGTDFDNMLIDLYSTYQGYTDADPDSEVFNQIQFGFLDVLAGDFTLELNYGDVDWETGNDDGGVLGQAGTTGIAPWVGFSNGAGLGFEVDGSGIAGALLSPDGAGGQSDEFCLANPLSLGYCRDIAFQFIDGIPYIDGVAVSLDQVSVPEPDSLWLLLLGGLLLQLQRFSVSRRKAPVSQIRPQAIP